MFHECNNKFCTRDELKCCTWDSLFCLRNSQVFGYVSPWTHYCLFPDGSLLRLKFFLFFFQHVINLSFMDAAKGCNKDITTRMRVICNRCDGKRAEPGTTYSQCTTCNGTGEVGYMYGVIMHVSLFHCLARLPVNWLDIYW